MDYPEDTNLEAREKIVSLLRVMLPILKDKASNEDITKLADNLYSEMAKMGERLEQRIDDNKPAPVDMNPIAELMSAILKLSDREITNQVQVDLPEVKELSKRLDSAIDFMERQSNAQTELIKTFTNPTPRTETPTKVEIANFEDFADLGKTQAIFSAKHPFVYNGQNQAAPLVPTASGLAQLVTGAVSQGSSPWVIQQSGVNFFSVNNSSQAPLAAGASFIGVDDDLTNFAGSTISLTGTAATTASGVLYFEYSPDGITWNIAKSFTVADINTTLILEPLRTILPHFRVRYVNGSTNMTTIQLSVVHHRIAPEVLTRFLDQPITNSEPIKTVQSVTAGEYSSAPGTYDNVYITGRKTLLAEPPPLVTAQANRILVGSSAVHLDATPLTGRVAIEVSYPLSTAHTSGSNVDGVVWVGFTSGMNATTACRELQPGESWRLDVSGAVTLYAISNFASQPVTLTEFAP